MTIDRVAMKELLEKGSDQDLLREMLAFVAARMMDVEVESLTGAAHGERSPERTNQRNGYRTREWHTGVGTVPVAIPKLRKSTYFPSFLEPRRSADKAMIAVIQEAYVHGVSTRSVDDLVKAMGMTGISKSQVSRLCEEIDGRVKEFLNRPIEGSWPYVWIDATYVKVREGGRIISVATIVAVGVNTDGRREVLGKALGPSEAEPFWTQFLRSLTARGLRGVKLVISDAHEGIKAAVKKVFHASWQRCRVHFMRNAMAHAGVKQPRHGRRRHPHRLRAGDRGSRTGRMARRRRSTACEVPQALRAHGRRRERGARLHGLPEKPLEPNPLDQPHRAAQPGDQAAHQRRLDLPQRGRDRAAHRRHPARAERRVGGEPALHEPGNSRRPLR